MNNNLKKALKESEEWEIIELFKQFQIVFGIRDSMARYGLTPDDLVEEFKKHDEFDISKEDIEKLFSYQYDIDLQMISKFEAYFALKEASLIKMKRK
jgi:hypothetical protein